MLIFRAVNKILLLVAVIAIVSGSVHAQVNLNGRIYSNPNIMADVWNDPLKDLDKKMSESRTKLVADFEKKNRRKPNTEEMAEIDTKLKDARVKIEAVEKGIVTSVSVEFKSEKDIVMRTDMKIDENVLKMAGMGWMKRKALKAAMAVAPKSEKGTYVVKGNFVIMTDSGKDKDTLTLSNDGNYLYGQLGKNTKFKLKRKN